MALRVPTGLSPSKVSAFKSCPLAFRFSSIDKLPELPSVPARRGSLVHRALELLFCRPAPERTLDAALDDLARAVAELPDDPDYQALALTPEEAQRFEADAARHVRRYFELEDPTAVRAVGIELKMEATIAGVTLRGIIDRLDLDADGELVVTDYKTGRVPSERDERNRLGGVQFYAAMCEQAFGRRPVAVQLLYLAEPVAIVARPSEQSVRFMEKQVGALWSAVERACASEDFRPSPSRLCDWCGYKAYCPSFGGDLSAVPRPEAVLDGVPGAPLTVPA